MFGFAIMILGLGAIGAIYQAIATRIDQRTYTPPGQLVDIGGRSIHMILMGEDTGQPTVILEAGMATFSSNYSWIQNELAAMTRVVAYDRAGLGWSDPSPEPQDAQQSARDLHAALQSAGIQPPYVVAGHSYGGLVVRAFTGLYPDEVAGMVLVDASHPDQWAHIPASREGRLNGTGNLITGFLARFGVIRLFKLGSATYAGLPERPAAEMRAILARPESWQTSGEVMLIWNERSRPQINQARSLGELPLAVLSVTEQPNFVADVLTRLQDELPSLSSNSIHHSVAGATHESLVAEREHAMVVAQTIRLVLESARTGRPLAEISPTGK
jgi:pimeloyl-ACP methyl ester carboxylesterase